MEIDAFVEKSALDGNLSADDQRLFDEVRPRIETLGLHKLFHGYQPKDWVAAYPNLAGRISRLSNDLADPVAKMRAEILLEFGETPLPPESDYYLGVGHVSGVLTDTREIHILDLCSGNGELAAVMMFLRSEIAATTASCIDDGESFLEKCARTERKFGLRGGILSAMRGDVADIGQWHHPVKPTHVMSIHSCIPATDIILGKLRDIPDDALPRSVTIIPCCRHRADEKVWHSLTEGTGIEHNETQKLRSLLELDPTTISDYDPKKKFMEVVRRIMDTLRIRRLLETERFEGSVHEMLDPDMIASGQVIHLETHES